MKTRPNKNIKKLSTAIRRGVAIGKENNIKKGTGDLIETKSDDTVCKACTLGFALIGVLGVDGARDLAGYTGNSSSAYRFLKEKFGNDENACLVKELKTPLQKSAVDIIEKYNDMDEEIVTEVTTPSDFVIGLNDDGRLSPLKIADKLENCKL